MRFYNRTRLAVGFASAVAMLTACSDDDSNPVFEADAGDDGGVVTTNDLTDTTEDTFTVDTTDTTGPIIGTTDTDTTVSTTDVDTTDVDTTDVSTTDVDTTDVDTTDVDTTDVDTTDMETSDVPDGGIDDGGTDTVGPDAAWDGATPDDSDAGDAGAPDGATDASMGGDLVFPASAAVDNARVPDGFAAWQWADGLSEPRGITVDESGNVLVVEQDSNRVLALWDEDGDGVSGDDERTVVAAADGLNHGIALNGGYLYASSATTVYRWEYTDERAELGEGTPVVTGMPAGGNHVTRTLVFDDNYLIVSVGSAANVDPNSERAQIRRFPIASLGSSTDYYAGELFADGVRNEVGLAIDLDGRVWGVENGMDNLSDDDFGGDIHNDNPGEELHLFATPGAFYGYPYCWSEYQLPGDAGMGAGTQWALEGHVLEDAGALSDEWCQDPENVVAPELVFPAHVAPLGILFYNGTNFPNDYVGDALVTFHGSWNADPPIGYKVVRVPFGEDGMPEGSWESLYEFGGPGDTGNQWNERPVDLVVLPNGTVLVTSDDDADRIVAIGYAGQ